MFANRASNIMIVLGGIRIPRAPPALTLPSAMVLSYFRSNMEGSATIPTVTVAAALIPTMAANMAQIATVPIARPPLSRLIQWYIVL